MQDEQIKHVLAAARPDGADDADPAIRAALECVGDDEALAQWLAESRAFDKQFSDALLQVTPPEGLKDEILAGMRLSAEEAPTETRAKVLDFPKALASIGLTLAAAAGLVLAVGTVIRTPQASGQPGQAQLSASIVPPLIHHLTGHLTSGGFPGFEMQSSELDPLRSYLAKHRTPAPGKLPLVLHGKTPLGCLQIEFQGHPIGMVCFGEKNTLHLFTMSAEAVGQLIPVANGCVFFEDEGIAYRVWQEGDLVYILGSKGTIEEIRQLPL